MKQIDDQHGEIDAPKPGGHEKGVRPKARAPQIIVRLDPNFDIDSVFQAEPELIKPETKAPPVESLLRVDPEPIVVESSEPLVVEPVPVVVEATPLVVEPASIIVEPPPLVVEQPIAASVAVAPREPDPVREPVLVPAPLRMAPAPPVESFARSSPKQPAADRAKAPSLSIADLLENHVRLEWHEAVAIAQHLCRVMARDPAANVHRSLVEPWNVEITNDGEVQVLPGGSSSDPLVKQVGRVLRTLLQDSVAPAELRLVASQASFDVPVYSGVDELSAALRHFERPGDSSAIRAAFNRGLEAKLSGVQAPARAPVVVRPPAVAPIEIPKRAAFPPPVRLRARWKHLPVRTFATLALLTAVIAAMVFVASRMRTVLEAPVSETRMASAVEPLTQPQPANPVPAGHAIEAERPAAPVAVPKTPPARVGNNAAAAAAPAASRRAANPVAGTPGPRRQAPDARGAAPAAALADSIAAHEHQATGLLASGRADEAAMFFDAIVLKDPFYQPDPARMSAEALSAFRNSKRTILPAMARRHYLDARAAFDAGDFTLAITEGERAMALLNNLNDLDGSGATGDLSADLTNLMTLSSASRTLEEEKIYTAADSGVTPPRPLGRQLSLASMSRVSLMPTGRLEILIGRSGRVETVKLDTPVNGYHDRMLVSAVKAWHYRPAIRNGRPVRFSLVMTIRLPDL